MKFALFGHARGVSSPSVERHLLASLQVLGDEVVSELTPDVDMVISLGGDGTFLRSAEKVGSAGIPIVGVNTGHLGFLADVSPEEVDAFLACIHQGQYEVRSRSVLQAEVVSPRPSLQSRMLYALNEVAVTKHDSASMISIQVSVNGEILTTYHSDGLLVCTPTGSTAYSLSAGGPIIHPQSDVMLLTAVAPHSLNMRPIIISDNKVIELVVDSRSGHFLVAADGQSTNYDKGTHIILRKAPYRINVVKQTGSTWFSTLRQKMNWGI